MPKKKKLLVLSVGGSIIIPKTGFDINFLKKFRQMIVDGVKQGYRFILVVGGGATCRQYNEALKKVSSISVSTLDWQGIRVTRLNAEFVKNFFGDMAYASIIEDPQKKVKTAKPILISGGWKPGRSTDDVAVRLAITYGADTVINLSNIDYVYDSDPRKNPQAKPIKNISWKDFRQNILKSDKWIPGANLPFDPTASKTAQKAGLEVVIMNGNNLPALKKLLIDNKITGTLIS